MDQLTKKLPVIPLRGMTVLPKMIIHFDVSREKSVAALEAAMQEEKKILLISQLNPEDETVNIDELYKIGTIAQIKQLVKLPKDIIRVIAEGEVRAELHSLEDNEQYLVGEAQILDEENNLDTSKTSAMLRYLLDLFDRYIQVSGQLSKELAKKINKEQELPLLIDELCNSLQMPYNKRQELLEAVDYNERFLAISTFLNSEIEMIEISRDIQEKVKEKIDKNQRDYVLREQLKVIREELGEENIVDEAEEFMTRLEELNASDEVKSKILKELNRFKMAGNSSSETNIMRTYLEAVLDMPWDNVSKDCEDLEKAEEILRTEHYGLEKIKERIIEYLTVQLLAKKGDSPILCLVGPPGTGKTSIAKSIANALDKKYVRMSLGGLHDEAEIRGHRKTYLGAMPGRFAAALKQAKVKNPLILLDEIDKVGSDYKGDPFAALLEVLDGEQNNQFRDNYLEIPIDLSEVLFVATANSLTTIPRPLLDRMEIIEVSSYTENEKVHIAKDHLIKKQLEKHSLTSKNVVFLDSALEKIIHSYTKEAGVRLLERKIGDVCRKCVRPILEEGKRSIKITDKNIEKYLGKPLYTTDENDGIAEIGVVTGLAWTSVGGDTLSIEVNILPGKGKFEVTGQLGDVMKESARAAISYIRSIASEYDIDKTFFEENDIHIHIPEGAVPKDGPSAGITMATALFSAITKQEVMPYIAMTGEITLRGRVLPIGGLKEKLLAAKKAGVKIVIVPMKNKKDVIELDDEIKRGLKIVYAYHMDDVLKTAISFRLKKEGRKCI